jgi:phosphoglycolate phosphatase-like HAD superfamily hydrolase/ADP-ribose pyrophosphatase YjhB (NUDIX family)
MLKAVLFRLENVLVDLHEEYTGIDVHVAAQPGMVDLIRFLKRYPIKLCLLTDFSRARAVELLNTTGFGQFADLIVTKADIDAVYKANICVFAATELGIENLRSIAVVSDRFSDIDAGTKATMETIAAGWGKGRREELSIANRTIDEPAELLKFFLEAMSKRISARPEAEVEERTAVAPAKRYLLPAAAALVFDDNRRILLARRTKDPGKGSLSLPIAPIHFGEGSTAALKKSLLADLGIEVNVIDMLHFEEYLSQEWHIIAPVYAVEIASGKPAPKMNYAEIVWKRPFEVTKKDVSSFTWETLQELLKKGILER